MKRSLVFLSSLALALVLSAPAWAVVDITASAEYVLNGKGKMSIASTTGSADLKGGVLLKAQASILGFTGGAEYYTDKVKPPDSADITELKVKAGYGLGLPGADITFLATYANWELDI